MAFGDGLTPSQRGPGNLSGLNRDAKAQALKKHAANIKKFAAKKKTHAAEDKTILAARKRAGNKDTKVQRGLGGGLGLSKADRDSIASQRKFESGAAGRNKKKALRTVNASSKNRTSTVKTVSRRKLSNKRRSELGAKTLGV